MTEKRDKRSWCAVRSIPTFCKYGILRRSVFRSTRGEGMKGSKCRQGAC
jgi:hypothetical protein